MSPWLSDVPNPLADSDAVSVIFSTTSTNATADNLPGPGRNIGRLYSFSGKRLEKVIGKLAVKAGYDPQVKSTRLRVVRNYDEASESFDSSQSTNMTEDGLPGAGRTIGLFYSAAGKLLEGKLRSTAERFGRGPHLTAVRIKNQSSELLLAASTSELTPAEIQERYAKLEKDCMLLIKYVQSKSPLTRRQALDNITELSVLEPYLRGLLNVIGAPRLIDPILDELDLDSKLVASTRRALVSLSDARLHTIAKEIVTICSRLPAVDNSPEADFLFNNLFQYLQNPNLSFLVARHLDTVFTEGLANAVFHAISKNINQLAFAFGNLEGNVEWHTLDIVLDRLVTKLAKSDVAFLGHTWKNHAYWDNMLERILRYAEKLPKTINNVVFTWLGHFEQADDIYEMRHGWLMLVLLRGVRNANANLNKASVGLFESVYSHKKTKLLVKRLSCRSEILFYELITGTTMDDFSTYLNLLHCSTLSVLNPIIVAKGCQELVSELYGDGEYSRHRAQLNIRVLHSRDVMFQTAICSALEHDPRTSTMTCGLHDGSSSLFSMLPLCTPSEDVNWEKYKKAVIFRHVDANGTLVHLFTVERRGECDLTRIMRGTPCRYEDTISWVRDDVLNMRKFTGERFDLATRGYHPIVAGRCRTGQTMYIGWHPGTGIGLKGSPGMPCIVTEGTSTATVRSVLGDEHTVHDFFVFLLRYEPAAYPTVRRYAGGIPADAMDATGPLFWERTRDLRGGGVDPQGALRGLLRMSLR